MRHPTACRSPVAGGGGGFRCPLTRMVCTPCYRAPEVVMSRGGYTAAIDMWGAGCVFGELLQRVAWIGKATTPQLQVRRRRRARAGCTTLAGCCAQLCTRALRANPRPRPRPRTCCARVHAASRPHPSPRWRRRRRIITPRQVGPVFAIHGVPRTPVPGERYACGPGSSVTRTELAALFDVIGTPGWHAIEDVAAPAWRRYLRRMPGK